MTTPEFSVIVPLYNKAAHIVDTLNSVRAQTLPPKEVIVVDDGSTDQGANHVETLIQGGFPGLRLIRQANGGVSVARNTGIAASSADYIAFLDGDDLWLPELLAEMAQLIKHFPEAGGFSTAFAHFTPAGNVTPIQPHFPARYQAQSHFLYDYFEAAATGELPAMTSTTCIPKRVLDEVGGFPPGEKIGEDQDVWIRVGQRYSFAYSRRICMHYLVEAENRASVMHVPASECPFSLRLKNYAESSGDPRRELMLKLTANHLLHLAQLNIRARKFDAARRLLGEQRTWKLPIRRVKWELAFWLARCGLIFRRSA